ncbi:MAG: hypothetical protein U9R37_00545 [Campylobacterota bacterium]|nr:hypothetical protein [Campylobacterota bacterium]
MIPYTTYIDTIAIQINCRSDSNKQREILLGIKEYLRSMFNAYIEYIEYKVGFDTRIEHKVYCNNRSVLSVITGFSNNNYYLKITFAGLSTYDTLVDDTSYIYLFNVVAYINSNQLNLSISELDIVIDIPNVSFDNLLTFCSSHTSGTQYHDLGEIQLYDGETNYIEKFKDRYAASVAIKRAYLYDKRVKELNEHNYDIGYEVQRFEVKLNSRYFNKYGLDISTLEHTLSKYHLLYFENIIDKYNIINRYNNYSKVTKREIGRMDLEQYRLHPDMDYINTFLFYIQTITMDDLYSD